MQPFLSLIIFLLVASFVMRWAGNSLFKSTADPITTGAAHAMSNMLLAGLLVVIAGFYSIGVTALVMAMLVGSPVITTVLAARLFASGPLSEHPSGTGILAAAVMLVSFALFVVGLYTIGRVNLSEYPATFGGILHNGLSPAGSTAFVMLFGVSLAGFLMARPGRQPSAPALNP